MNKKIFITLMDDNLKLIRTEYGLTQDIMAVVLGISKKTLVEIEKKRKSLGWTTAVALATIFSGSAILQNALGTDIPGIIIALAFQDTQTEHPTTLGGRVWWTTVLEKKGHKIQQNVLSRHYRLLDSENHRLFSSFSLTETEAMLQDFLNLNSLKSNSAP